VTSKPAVSVIIPAYNAAAFICETLDSVLAQTDPATEIIVVDDGSTDATAECVRRYGDRVRYVWQPNSGGVSSPRNHGIRIATGEILAFIDADDLMTPCRIATAVEVMMRHPNVALVLTNFRHFDERGVDLRDHFQTCPDLDALLEERSSGGAEVVLTRDDSLAVLATENFGSSASIVRREAIRTLGGYDEDRITSPSGDYCCNYRIAARHDIAVVPEVLLLKRGHSGNMSGDAERMLRAQIKTRGKLLAEASTHAERRRLRRVIAQYHLSLAYHYTGRDTRSALRHALIGTWLNRRPNVRHFARILADLAGRDTLAHGRADGAFAVPDGTGFHHERH
jgi:glycosyltransferase involved in cell wall biosynthesis